MKRVGYPSVELQPTPPFTFGLPDGWSMQEIPQGWCALTPDEQPTDDFLQRSGFHCHGRRCAAVSGCSLRRVANATALSAEQSLVPMAANGCSEPGAVTCHCGASVRFSVRHKMTRRKVVYLRGRMREIILCCLVWDARTLSGRQPCNSQRRLFSGEVHRAYNASIGMPAAH